MKIDSNILTYSKYPLLFITTLFVVFSLRSEMIFLTALFFALATFVLYKFLKNRSSLSPLIVLFLFYSYINNVLGPMLMHFNNDSHLINSAGIISTNSIYKLPLIYLIQLLLFVLINEFFNKRKLVFISPSIKLITRVNYILAVSLLIISLSIIFNFPDWLQYLGYGFNNYISFAPFFIGYKLHNFKRRTLIILLLLYIPSFILLSLVNSRGLAVFPLISFLLGFILYSEVRFKIKRNIILISLIILPVYFVISNIGRLGNEHISSGELNNEVRLQNIALLFSGDLGTDLNSAIQLSVTNRIFPIGGYTIIHKTPDIVPYRSLKLVEYLKISENSSPDKFKLIDYGFRITENHSIGITLFGDFWMYGGWFSLIIGLLIFTMFVTLNIELIYRIKRLSPSLSYLILISQLNIFFYAQGRSLPSFFNAILTSYLIALLLKVLLTLKINTNKG